MSNHINQNERRFAPCGSHIRMQTQKTLRVINGNRVKVISLSRPDKKRAYAGRLPFIYEEHVERFEDLPEEKMN